jgi:rhodanese-related sulfurtransferase
MHSKSLVQTAAIIVTSVVLALVANAFASRDRKVTLTGSYPNALRVPPREAPVASPRIAPAAQGVAPAASPAIPDTTLSNSSNPAGATLPGATTTVTTPSHPTRTATAAIETVGLNPAAKTPKAPAPAFSSTATSSASNDDPLKRFSPHPDKPFVEIAFADVNALHAKNVLFLDARRTSVYEQGHIPGARTYSVWEADIDDKVRKLFDERSDPRDQALPIVIYCSGGDCEDSHMLAQKLWGIQFNNVYVYKDGFPDWQSHGAPVHTGANP